MKNLLLPLIILIFVQISVAQDFHNTENSNNRKLFKDLLINTSYVNLGKIDHFGLYLNFDNKRYWMYYGLGVEYKVSDNLSFRIDYFSNYNRFFDLKSFLNPSVVTLAPRIYFMKSSRTRPFFDFKVGIAATDVAVFASRQLISPIPFVGGFKTGIVSELNDRFSLGFSIDNFGIIYKYTTFIGSEIRYDASRFSLITTDIYYHIFKNE